MQRLEVSGAVRPIYGSLCFKRFMWVEFSRQIFFRKNHQISDFMRIRPVGDEWYYAGGQTDGHDPPIFLQCTSAVRSHGKCLNFNRQNGYVLVFIEVTCIDISDAIFRLNTCNKILKEIYIAFCRYWGLNWQTYYIVFSLPVTWGSTSLTFNNCTLCPHCIYVFCIYLRTNSDLCHLQHKLIGFYNPEEKCLQRGTDWGFK